jgi:hypothetical protein
MLHVEAGRWPPKGFVVLAGPDRLGMGGLAGHPTTTVCRDPV